MTTEQLARRVQKDYYYDYDYYDSKEARDNAIKADLREQISVAMPMNTTTFTPALIT